MAWLGLLPPLPPLLPSLSLALATLASQGNYNPSGANFCESMLNPLWGDPFDEVLHPFDGYWAYMNVAKEFGVVVVE
ncbi:unnamed protein product [marine sediment metagenome]|uniref:Uncharacterized protein n=1 Tax=marine sediment metagenome TaxID=412755 RepID=X1CEZ7_9ZZZZ